jgi:hypothetical protein
MKWEGHAEHMQQMRNAYKILVGKPEGKISLKRSRCRMEGFFLINLTEVGWEGVDLIHLAEDSDRWWALVNMVMNFHVL